MLMLMRMNRAPATVATSLVRAVGTSGALVIST
jgi:hypothetical protein